MKLRVVVCGTTFGRVYLKAIANLKEDFQLVGILARGSQTARECAEEYNVPLFTCVNELEKKEIDLACVVIRSTIVGGQGTLLTQQLLDKGIDVIQEHPVYYDDLIDCYRLAKKNNCSYYINSFYPDIITMRKFIEIAHKLVNSHQILYLEASCSIQVLFPMIDIIGKTLKVFSSWDLKKVNMEINNYNVTLLSGNIKKIPVLLKVFDQMNPSDPDNLTPFFHSITLQSNVGRLLITDTHGDVLWQPNMYVPRNDNKVLDMFGENKYVKRHAIEKVYSLTGFSLQELFAVVWPESIQHILLKFKEKNQHNNSFINEMQCMLSTCQIWKNISSHLVENQTSHDAIIGSLTLNEIMKER